MHLLVVHLIDFVDKAEDILMLQLNELPRIKIDNKVRCAQDIVKKLGVLLRLVLDSSHSWLLFTIQCTRNKMMQKIKNLLILA